MATLLTKKSDTASSVPLAADLTNAAGGAELAVNTADKRLYSKTSGGTVVELGTNPSSMTLPSATSQPSGSANGIPYLNGSKVLTTGSALTFDGTSLGVRQNTGGIGNYSEVVLDITNSFSGSGKSYLRNISLNGGNSSTALAFGVNADGGGVPSEQMRLTSTGLGIGTSSPAYKLDVYGSGTPVAAVRSSASGDAKLYLECAGTNSGYVAYNRSLQALTFSGNNSTNHAVLDSSGNLGLGVTPSAWGSGGKLEMGAGQIISMQGAANLASNAYYNAGWKYTTSTFASYYSQSSGQHQWYTAPSGTAGNAISFTQAMTLDASGNLLVGTTSNGNSARMVISASGATRLNTVAATTGAETHVLFSNPNGNVGSITTNGTVTAYNMTSDQRLKENIQEADSASELIDLLQVRKYDWKADGSHQRYGFIAQELVTVAPEAVHQPEDPEEMMAVDYSKLVPMLVKEIQSLRARVAQLESK